MNLGGGLVLLEVQRFMQGVKTIIVFLQDTFAVPFINIEKRRAISNRNCKALLKIVFAIVRCSLVAKLVVTSADRCTNCDSENVG